MKILLNSDIPIYKQISADFKERIMNGTISAGEYLPSIRGLAKEYMRLLEQHLQDALDCARLAGLSVDEVCEVLKTLGSIE